MLRPALAAGVVLLVAGGVASSCRIDDARKQLSLDSVASPARILLADGAFEVVGLTDAQLGALERAELDEAGWAELFPVRTGAAPDDGPNVIGSYAIADDVVRFTPRFRVTEGLTYEASFAPGRGETEALRSFGDVGISGSFEIPRSMPESSTTVVAVYPSSDRVPMNLLKLYLHFSAPMRLGEAYEHIRLLDEDDQVVEDAFLVVREELWDPERRRFTLFLDPGRIKEDLVPHEQLGLPLNEGRRYTLVVDQGWRDGAGNPLAGPFFKHLEVADLDRTSPAPDGWVLDTPAVGSLEPLTIQLGEPMDHALLHRMITVRRGGAELTGTVEVAANESLWRFRPERPWTAGTYRIRVDPAIEDLAGNTPHRLFDEDRNARTSDPPENQVVELEFVIED